MGLKTFNVYQFNADPKLPSPLRQSLLETFEVCNEVLASFYADVAREVLADARAHGLKNIVELGAGHAPLTRLMVNDPASQGLHFVICDLIPAVEQYEELARQHPERITALSESVDFSVPRTWPAETLLVLCAAIHHVPTQTRPAIIHALSMSADRVMVFAPVRKTWRSLFLSMSIFFPAVALPLLLWNKPGSLRRLLWCWLIPVVPLIALWDGFGGSLRQWSDREWLEVLASETAKERKPLLKHWGNRQLVAW